jgi:hypothetical protein
MNSEPNRKSVGVLLTITQNSWQQIPDNNIPENVQHRMVSIDSGISTKCYMITITIGETLGSITKKTQELTQ